MNGPVHDILGPLVVHPLAPATAYTDRQVALSLAVEMHGMTGRFGDIAKTACELLGWLEAHAEGEAASRARDLESAAAKVDEPGQAPS